MKTIQIIIVGLLLSGYGVSRRLYMEDKTAVVSALEGQLKFDNTVIQIFQQFHQRLLDLENKDAEYRRQQSLPYGPKTEIIPQ